MVRPFSFLCSVERADTPVPPADWPLPQPPFRGQCYLCDGIGHSQKFCPLAFCFRCRKYGHNRAGCGAVNWNLRSPRIV